MYLESDATAWVELLVINELSVEFTQTQIVALMQDLRSTIYVTVTTAGKKLLSNPDSCPPYFLKALLTSQPELHLIAVALLTNKMDFEMTVCMLD